MPIERSANDLGEAIRKLRLRTGLTQVEMAERMGLKNHSALSNIERNTQGVTINMMERIGMAVDMSVEAVMLFCLQHKYPKLLSTEVGRELRELTEDANLT